MFNRMKLSIVDRCVLLELRTMQAVLTGEHKTRSSHRKERPCNTSRIAAWSLMLRRRIWALVGYLVERYVRPASDA